MKTHHLSPCSDMIRYNKNIIVSLHWNSFCVPGQNGACHTTSTRFRSHIATHFCSRRLMNKRILQPAAFERTGSKSPITAEKSIFAIQNMRWVRGIYCLPVKACSCYEHAIAAAVVTLLPFPLLLIKQMEKCGHSPGNQGSNHLCAEACGSWWQGKIGLREM